MARGLRFSANNKKNIKYHKLVENGFCGKCGKEREQKDKSRCNKCLKKAKLYISKIRNRKKDRTAGLS